MAVQKRRVALVGLGMVVGAHVRSLNDLADRVEIAYAYSPTAARREAFAAQFLVPTCDRLETILDDPSIDAVIVLTPPNTHLDIVGRCAAAGKHVLLEKPLEITTERATQMVAACEAAGVTLGIVLQHRFRPAAEALARMLAAGDLGEIAGCSTIIRLWRPQAYYDEPGRGSLALSTRRPPPIRAFPSASNSSAATGPRSSPGPASTSRSTTAAPSGSHRWRPPAAPGPIRWISRMTGTAAPSPISSMRWTESARRVSRAARR